MIQINVRRDLLPAGIRQLCDAGFSFDISRVLKGLTTLQTGTTSQSLTQTLMVFYLQTLKTGNLESLGKRPTGCKGWHLIYYYFNCLTVLRESITKVPGAVFKGRKTNIEKCYLQPLVFHPCKYKFKYRGWSHLLQFLLHRSNAEESNTAAQKMVVEHKDFVCGASIQGHILISCSHGLLPGWPGVLHGPFRCASMKSSIYILVWDDVFWLMA